MYLQKQHLTDKHYPKLQTFLLGKQKILLMTDNLALTH